MVCPSSLHKTGQHYYPDSKKLVSIEDASEKILDELMQDLRVQVRTARQELEGCDVQVVSSRPSDGNFPELQNTVLTLPDFGPITTRSW